MNNKLEKNIQPELKLVKLSKHRKSSTTNSLKQLMQYLWIFKKRLIAVFIISIIYVVINILSILIVARVTGDLVTSVAEITDKDKWYLTIMVMCGILIGLYVIYSLLNYVQNFIMVRVAQRTGDKIRRDLFDKIQKLPVSYYDQHSSGDLMSRLTNDVNNITTTLSQNVSQIIVGFITIVGMILAMFIVSSFLALITIACVPILMSVSILLAKRSQPLFISLQNDLGNMNGYIEEMISGQKVIHVFEQEDYVVEEFEKINKKLSKTSAHAQSLAGIIMPWNGFTNNVLLLVVTIIGIVFALTGTPYGGIGDLKGSGEIGSATQIGAAFTVITSFTLYMRQFVNPLNQIMQMANMIQGALAGANRAFEVFEAENEDHDYETKTMKKCKGHVEIKDLNFSYDGVKPILKNINIEAKAGQTIAIVGPTGSGKTTIINLLTKFYDVTDGTILMDHVDMKNITKESVRDNVSIVLQDTFLFSSSVRENIRHGDPKASDHDVMVAAMMANAHNFIMQLDEGYDTVLSDNGEDLSQGQRQLLAIAQAILSKSNILILDEATSSIDTKTEVEIQSAMLNLMKNKTSFVIAHRLSTVRNADVIVVLKDGEILEKGNHDTLLELNGFYANLFNAQFRKKDELKALKTKPSKSSEKVEVNGVATTTKSKPRKIKEVKIADTTVIRKIVIDEEEPSQKETDKIKEIRGHYLNSESKHKVAQDKKIIVAQEKQKKAAALVSKQVDEKRAKVNKQQKLEAELQLAEQVEIDKKPTKASTVIKTISTVKKAVPAIKPKVTAIKKQVTKGSKPKTKK